MKTMIAKYPGKCCNCGKAIVAGTPIKFYGRGRAGHANCYSPEGKSDSEIASEVRAPCWICGDSQGKFRSMGAATPVWCDACNEKEQAKRVSVGQVRINYTRFSSGAEVFQNSRGRCEDAPCCGCCS